MREQERRLLRCITAIDDELILEADTARFRPRPWGGLIALAACLALVIALPFHLNGGQEAGSALRPGDGDTVPHQSTAPAESFATEAATGHDHGDGSGQNAMDTATYNHDPIVRTETFGGLKLGIPVQKVLDILGDPEKITDTFNSTIYTGQLSSYHYPGMVLVLGDLGEGLFLNEIYVTGAEAGTFSTGVGIGSAAAEVEAAYPGILRVSDPAWGQIYTTNLKHNGIHCNMDEDVVAGIMFGPLVLDFTIGAHAMPNFLALGGVMPGMTEDMVQTVLGEPAKVLEDSGDGLFRWCYEAMTVAFHSFDRTVSWVLALDGSGVSLNNGINFSTGQEEVARRYPGAYVTEGDPAVDKHDTRYTVEGDFITLTIETVKGSVTTLRLEDHRNPLLEALYADEIALYLSTGEGWLIVDAVDKAAKRIATILTISEPEPTDMPEGMPTAWLEFGSGAVVGLLGDDCAVVYSCDGNFDPDSNDNLTPHLSGRFEGLDDALTEARLNPTATWEETAEAPEAESAAP